MLTACLNSKKLVQLIIRSYSSRLQYRQIIVAHSYITSSVCLSFSLQSGPIASSLPRSVPFIFFMFSLDLVAGSFVDWWLFPIIRKRCAFCRKAAVHWPVLYRKAAVHWPVLYRKAAVHWPVFCRKAAVHWPVFCRKAAVHWPVFCRKAQYIGLYSAGKLQYIGLYSAGKLQYIDLHQAQTPSLLILPFSAYLVFLLAQQPPVGQGLLIRKVSRSHSTTHHSR